MKRGWEQNPVIPRIPSEDVQMETALTSPHGHLTDAEERGFHDLGI